MNFQKYWTALLIVAAPLAASAAVFAYQGAAPSAGMPERELAANLLGGLAMMTLALLRRERAPLKEGK